MQPLIEMRARRVKERTKARLEAMFGACTAELRTSRSWSRAPVFISDRESRRPQISHRPSPWSIKPPATGVLTAQVRRPPSSLFLTT